MKKSTIYKWASFAVLIAGVAFGILAIAFAITRWTMLDFYEFIMSIQVGIIVICGGILVNGTLYEMYSKSIKEEKEIRRLHRYWEKRKTS